MSDIISKKDIIDLWLRSGGSQSRIPYAMSILLGKGIVKKVCSGIYRIQDTRLQTSSSVTAKNWVIQSPEPALPRRIVQKQQFSLQWHKQWNIYWQIITKLIEVHSPSGGVIGGEKSLELHLQNNSVPDILIIYTRSTALRIRLTDCREVHMRTLVSWPKTGKKNLWRTLIDNSIQLQLPEKIQVCGIELSLLEALSLRRHDTGIEEGNIVRFLRSFAPAIDRDRLGQLTRLRYIRPLNRLRVLARDLGYSELYIMTLEIIRNEGGGCYLNL